MARIEEVAEERTLTREVSLSDKLSIDREGVVRYETQAATEVSDGRGGVARVERVTRRALPEDAPVRDDLPEDHPLCNTRALKHGMSGWTDMVIGPDGRLMPAIEQKEEPDPKPIEPKPKPIDEEVRGDLVGERTG